MSRFLTKKEDGTYIEEIESMEECKYRIDDVCCNEDSEYLCEYCYHAEIKPPCFVKEDGII